MRNAIRLLVAAAGLAWLSGCETQSYCFFDCDDGGVLDDASGAGGSDSGKPGTGGLGGFGGTCINCGDSATGGGGPCVKTNNGIEICDNLDNDCNGQIDEPFDLSRDIQNCGQCGNDCTQSVVGALEATCTAEPGEPGKCGYTSCSEDHYDVNGDSSDGCEYYCVKQSDKDDTCNNIDDDCNGRRDDAVDKCTDANNCGLCGRNCQGKPHATGRCIKTDDSPTCDDANTKCEIASCEDGWVDTNGNYYDGCECRKTKLSNPDDPTSLVECAPGEACDIEYCGDGKDNDCDGKADSEDPDLLDPAKADPRLNKACYGGNAGVCTEAAHAGITMCVGNKVVCVDNNLGSNNCATDADCASTAATPYCIDGVAPGTKVCGTKVLAAATQPEKCDGKDNDCDGVVDDSPVDATGVCGIGLGECPLGVLVCEAGERKCSVSETPATAEDRCDGRDNNCDGVIDGVAAVPEVRCVADSDCAGQAVAKFCVPAIGKPGAPKVCASLASDVDSGGGVPKECGKRPDPPAGWTSPCRSGVMVCRNATIFCDGAVGPVPGAQDGCKIDANCDGVAGSDIDTNTNPQHCGACGHDCAASAPAGTNNNWICEAGVCKVDPANPCVTGFIDCDGSKKCTTPCSNPTAEVCDGKDNDCNCQVDEVRSATYPNGIVLPSVVQTCGVGPAATGTCLDNTRVECVGASRQWRCIYPPNHCQANAACNNGLVNFGDTSSCCSKAADKCDGLDNNCDGFADEKFTGAWYPSGPLGQMCYSDDGLPQSHGACQTEGTYQCNAAGDGTQCRTAAGLPVVPKVCGAGPGQLPCDEKCDGIDNDCDGQVDETYTNPGPNRTYFVKPQVAKVRNNLWIYRYEASRHNATAQHPGSGNGWWTSSSLDPDMTLPEAGTQLDKTMACSEEGRIPWFNISGPEAHHVCKSMGGRLCTNDDWEYACRSGAAGCQWAFVQNCNTFNTTTNWTTCNLAPYDFDGVAGNGDQDGLLVTGKLPNCAAKFDGAIGKVYDLVGNLRELTCSGSNPCTRNQKSYTVMGGAFNSADPMGEGAKCNFTFYNVNESFKLFDVGFRCCFDYNPGIAD